MAVRTRRDDAAIRMFSAAPGMQRPAVHNADVARVFGEVADLLEIEQADPFGIRACRNAARIVDGLRLDLAASLATVCINSDAHDALDFAHLRYGIGQARRGWLEKADVLNTRSLAELQRLLRHVSVPTIT